MLTTSDHDKPPPAKKPPIWRLDDIVGAVGLVLCAICWVVAVIYVAVR